MFALPEREETIVAFNKEQIVLETNLRADEYRRWEVRLGQGLDQCGRTFQRRVLIR